MATEITIIQHDINDDIKDKIEYIQFDNNSRILQFEVTDRTSTGSRDSGDYINLNGCTVWLIVRKGSGEPVIIDGEILDADNGQFRFVLTEQVLAETGEVKCQYVITSPDARLSSREFIINVKASLADDIKITSSAELTALTEALQGVTAASAVLSVLQDGYAEYVRQGGTLDIANWVANFMGTAPDTGGGSGSNTGSTTHGVVWDLVNVTSSNAVVSVSDGASLVAVLTAANGYRLGDVTVTMAGEAITGVWNADTATVIIASVTGDVIISCAGIEFAETKLDVTWDSGQWTYSENAWSYTSGIATRGSITTPIDATDGYLRIRFNRQDIYDQYMSDAETDCPMIEVFTYDHKQIIATSRLSNINNPALIIANAGWQRLEWDTEYYFPAGNVYYFNIATNANSYMFDEDTLTFLSYSSNIRLGSSNANFKSIITTAGFCTITKVTGAAGSSQSVAQGVDAQYAQDGISVASLVPNDVVDGNPATFSEALKKTVSEWMKEYRGDTRKVPLIIHTDQHGRLSSNVKGVFTAIGNCVPWYDMSKIMNLGDCVSDHWTDADVENPYLTCTALENMMDCIDNIPISKRLDVFGNHDTWYYDADGNDVVVTNQAHLSQYFRNIFARNPNSNQHGYFVDYDNKYNIKYVVISGFEYTTSRSTYRISTEQMKFIIDEFSKDDGYDIVVVSHVPLYHAVDTGIYPTGMTPNDAAGTILRVAAIDTDALFNARKNKTSGTVTDSEGVEHNFDFSGCTTDILCGLHGHTHIDAYNYVSDADNGLVSATFDWFDGSTVHFVLIDRVNRCVNVWKVEGDALTYTNYQIPLDKAAE